MSWRNRRWTACRFRPTSWSTTTRWCARRFTGSWRGADRYIMSTTVSTTSTRWQTMWRLWCRRQTSWSPTGRCTNMNWKKLCWISSRAISTFWCPRPSLRRDGTGHSECEHDHHPRRRPAGAVAALPDPRSRRTFRADFVCVSHVPARQAAA